MRKNRVLIWLFTLCVFFSCNNADIDSVLSSEKNNDLHIHEIIDQKELEGGIDAEKLTLTEVDALTVAKLFNSGAIEARSGNSKSIKQLMSVSDDSGEPLMYIVNFEDNNGYVVISATKNMHAILAYSDEGNFDDSYLNTGMSIYMDEFKYNIKEIINKDIDSLRIKYALSWSSFEQQSDDLSVSTRSAADDKRRQEVLKWESLGYDGFPLSHLAAYVGSSEANNIISSLCQHTNSSYDCMTSAILLVKYISNFQGPLTQTAWHQREPFNVEASNRQAGCWTVALAQLMKYHHHPTSYVWSNISVNPTNNTDFDKFIKDIRRECKALYETNVTNISMEDAISALNNYFSYNTVLYDHASSYSLSDYSRIKSSITNNNPVIMRGHSDLGNGKTAGHAWLAHGYREGYYEIGIAYIPQNSNNYEYMSVKNDYMFSAYLNMNFGWGQNSEYIYYSSAISTQQPQYNLSVYRKYIIVTKK